MKKFLIIFIFVLFILNKNNFICESAELKIHFIDVGEGDSILIQTPRNKSILVDTGNLITGFKVAQYLKENDVQELECLVLTHPHLDHIGGVFYILQMISIKKVFDNGEDLAKISKSNNLYRWYEELVRKNHDYQSLKAEDEFFIDGVRFRTIWPYRSFINADFNSNSLVIVIEYGKFKCLLTGDLISSAEKEILKRSDKFKADILKVAHHGCDDASSIEFLKRVSPEISIISVDKDNINNFPSKKVLQRLKSIHSKVLRTDKSGNILIKINSEADIIKVLTER